MSVSMPSSVCFRAGHRTGIGAASGFARRRSVVGWHWTWRRDPNQKGSLATAGRGAPRTIRRSGQLPFKPPSGDNLISSDKRQKHATATGHETLIAEARPRPPTASGSRLFRSVWVCASPASYIGMTRGS